MEAFAAARSRPAEQLISVHLSIGIATTHEGTRKADELIRNADLAMYQAKEIGQGPLRGLRPQHARRRC